MHRLEEQSARIPREYFTLAEAASYLRIGRTQLRTLVRELKIKFIPLGKQYRFRKVDLDEYMESLVVDPCNIRSAVDRLTKQRSIS